MRNAVVRFAFAVVAFLLSANHAGAQWGVGDYPDPSGSPLCSDIISYWLAAAKTARDQRCSPGGPEWSTDVKTQGSFCLSASDSEKARRTETMKAVMRECKACSESADELSHMAFTNIIRGCGFSNADGRWTLNRDDRLKKCLSIFTFYDGIRALEYNLTRNEMLSQVDKCKLTHPDPRICKTCHDSNLPSAARTAPKDGAVFQDSIERLKRPSEPSTNRRATSPKRSVTSGNDLAKPSGGSGSNTSAMDRLSGDSQLPSPSSNPGGKTGDGSSGRLPASRGGASAVAKPVTAPAPLPKADPTTDFGKCASCGKPPAAPR